jgi:phosphoglycolate phosphatase-like HAD superfamily hydrolase
MNKQNLLLFDMDGTLVSGNGFLERYQVFLGEQLSEFFGKPIKINFSGLHGGTERRNLRILLKRQGIEPADNVLDDFFRIAGRRYSASSSDAILLPSVKETLESLSEKCFLGLSTGNPESIARKKLELFDLNRYFIFGGFGNESEIRGKLVELALSRAMDYDWKGKPGDAYVIGDTAQDVDSGKYAGIGTIGVTTGSGTREQLESVHPDYIIGNLSELEVVLN